MKCQRYLAIATKLEDDQMVGEVDGAGLVRWWRGWC